MWTRYNQINRVDIRGRLVINAHEKPACVVAGGAGDYFLELTKTKKIHNVIPEVKPAATHKQ